MQVLQGQEERAHGPARSHRRLAQESGPAPVPLLGRPPRWDQIPPKLSKGKLNSNSLCQDTRGGETLTIYVPRPANMLLWTDHTYDLGHLAPVNVGSHQGS